MSEKEFPKGLFAKRNDNAPDFVLCSLSVKKKEFVEYLRTLDREDEWCNFQVKRSQGGKVYVELDMWKPQASQAPQASAQPSQEQAFEDDIPFSGEAA